jgi:hypothetical protein
MSNDLPYQIAPQVAHLQAERENCVAYGNDRRVEQIDRQLADLGVKQQAAEKRSAVAEGEDNAKQAVPKGRRSKESTQTEG